MKYPRDTLLLVCIGPRCNNPDRGDERGEVIRAQLKEHNKSAGRKPSVRICGVTCLDLCEFGPNIVVQPGGEVYSHLDRESALRVYGGVMGDGAPADDKRLTSEEFEECLRRKETP